MAAINDSISGVFRPSIFRNEALPIIAEAGKTISDILRAIPNLPAEVWTHGVVRIGGELIYREHWDRVRPKPGATHFMDVCVEVRGGGGGGGKSILATVLSIALVIAVVAISGGALAGVAGAGLFAAGSTSATLLAAGVAVGGSLLMNALAPSPTGSAVSQSEADNASNDKLGAASFRTNDLGLLKPIPFVTGQHRVNPPHLIPAWTESYNDDQYVHAVLGLNGAHLFEDILINGASIDTFSDIEYETRDVINDDTDITLVTQQVFENALSYELTAHKVDDENPDELQDQSTPSNSYPQWISTATRDSPLEVWLTFTWSGLVVQTGSGSVAGGMPLRIRIRQQGTSTWVNLPEFHAQRERLGAFRGVIKLRFEAAPSSITRPDQYQVVPPWKYALYVNVAAESYTTNSYFQPGSGNFADNVGTDNGIITVYLDPDTFPPGTYDVQIMRGYGYIASSFVASTYTYSGTPGFFSYVPGSSPYALAQDQSKAFSTCSISSISSMWDDYPLTQKGFSLIAIKAKNIQISSLSVLATGYAYVWDGTDWDTFEPTKNPAAIWRTLALGSQVVVAPLIESQLDGDSLADWYDYCGDERTIGADFDGTNDYLTLDAGFTGGADDTQFTLAFWVRWDGGAGIIMHVDGVLAGAADPRFYVSVNSSGNVAVYGENSSSTTILSILSDYALPEGQFSHVLLSVDMANSSYLRLYINGISVNFTVTTFTATESIDFTGADVGIGGAPSGAQLFDGVLGELWFDPGTYLDFDTDANRLKFESAYGRPIDLGATGSTPTGSQPLVYLSGGADAFETNLGTGGGFTENGALVYTSIVGGANIARECNAYWTGSQSLQDVLNIVAATGRAACRYSNTNGVVIDRDRSADSPVAVFSQRNSRELTISRAFPRLPAGFRITFNDEDLAYAPRDIFVYRGDVTSTELEAIKYVGITSEDKARERAAHDFRQLLLRPRLYSLKTDIQSLYCTKGDLVSLSHDTLRRHCDSARVVSTTLSSGNLASMTLDSDLRFDLVGDAKAAVFDGTNDYLERTSGLTGSSDAKRLTVSFWMWLDADEADTTWMLIFRGVDTSTKHEIALTNGELWIRGYNSSGTIILNVQTTDTFAEYAAGKWTHVLMSVDLAVANSARLYIDDCTDFSDYVTETNDSMDFTFTGLTFGSGASGAAKFKGQLAEFWWQNGTYYDLDTESNRRKYISENGRPANLDSDGSAPTGTSPRVYFSGNDGDFPTNKGTGGAFTENGSLGTSAIYYDGVTFPAGVILQLKDGSTLTAQVDEETPSSTVTFSTAQSMPSYLTYQGAWATSTAYSIDDVVVNDGVAYSAIQAHTSAATDEPGTGADWRSYWELLLEDCLISSGPFSSVEKRMLVLDIKYEDDMTASVTLVDEGAPFYVTANSGDDDVYCVDGSRITTPY